MKADVCGEFGFVNSMNKKMWENRTKITYAFEQNRSRIKLFRNPGGGGTPLMRHCVSRLNNRQVTM